MDATATLDWDAAFGRRVGRMGASEIRELLKVLDQPGLLSFAGGIPDPGLFPKARIAEVTGEILGDGALAARALQYSTSEGYAPLREWIVRQMARRGVDCGPDNIVITAGSQQALDFVGKMLVTPGDTVLVTAPTYLGALQAFNAYEPRYDHIQPGGGNTTPAAYRAAAAEAGGRIAYAYAVPDFANPTGQSLTLAEREALLDLCAELGLPLVEDAAYEALRFEGEALPSLLALDIARAGRIERSRVIHCGTFSKTVAPAFRVGWICAASAFVRRVVLAKQAADLQCATLNQMIVHRVVEAEYETLTARAAATYRGRRDAMLTALARHMPPGVTWTRPEGGMFVWVTLPEEIDSQALLARALDAGIAYVPSCAFFSDRRRSSALRLSYSLLPEAAIEDGMWRLGGLVRATLERGGAA
jgi:DNA-binding transcriptional MocR family regulator